MEANNKLNILVVDDEKINVELVGVYLQEEGYKVSYALNAATAMEGILQRDIDLILLDINMPKIDGFTLCKSLKKDPKTKNIPIIFLTAQTDSDYISKAFEVGGVDYITKPFNPVELKARVATHLQIVKYVKELQHKQSKFAQLSITDPLTKLSNSLYFDSQIKMYQKANKPFWIVYFSIEKFEKINELYGFYKANKILRIFAKILQENSIKNTIIARLHGVNFAILLKDYDQKTITEFYKKIIQAITTSKELSNVIQTQVVLYYVKSAQTPLPIIYKTLHNEVTKLRENGEKFRFL